MLKMKLYISFLTFLTIFFVAAADRDGTHRGDEYGGGKLEETKLNIENSEEKSVTEHGGSYGKSFRNGGGVIYETREDNKRVIDGGVDAVIGGRVIRRRPVNEETGGKDGNNPGFRGGQYGGGQGSGYNSGDGVGVLIGGPRGGEHLVKSISAEDRGFLEGRNRRNGGSIYRDNYGGGHSRGQGVRYEGKDAVYNFKGGVDVVIDASTVGEGPGKGINGEDRGIIHGRKSGSEDGVYGGSYEGGTASSHGVRFEGEDAHNIHGRVRAFTPVSTTYERSDKGIDDEHIGLSERKLGSEGRVHQGNYRGEQAKGPRVRYEEDQDVYNIEGRIGAFIPGSTPYRRYDQGINQKQPDDVDGRGKGNEGRLYGGGGYQSGYGGSFNRRPDLKNAERQNVYTIEGRAGVLIPESATDVREKGTGERRYEISAISGRNAEPGSRINGGFSRGNAGSRSGEGGYRGSNTGEFDKGYGVRYTDRHGIYNIKGGVDTFIPGKAIHGGRVRYTD